jgi:hypothetical protein
MFANTKGWMPMRMYNRARWGSAGLLLAMLSAGLLVTARAADKKEDEKPAPRAAKSLEGLLKESGVDYTRHKDQDEEIFKIPVEIDGETTMVYAREHQLGNKSDAALRLVYLWTTVATMPKDFKSPAAMLKKMVQMNETFLVGNVSMNDSVISCNSSFWLRTADAEILKLQLMLAHAGRLHCRKELLPFLRE